MAIACLCLSLTVNAQCKFITKSQVIIDQAILKFNEAQLTNADCSVQASENVLKTLLGPHFDLRKKIKRWKWYKQTLSDGDGQVLDELTLNLRRLLSGLNPAIGVDRTYSTEFSSPIKLLNLLYENLRNKHGTILNFDQEKLKHGSKTGHFAVLAGVDLDKQTVLISDPDPRFGIFELSASTLFEAMDTIDSESNKPRGLITLRKNNY